MSLKSDESNRILMTNKKLLVSPLGQMYSTDEVAQILGVSRRTVQRMIRAGELAAIGKTRYLKIPAEELTRWKDEQVRLARERADTRRRDAAA